MHLDYKYPLAKRIIIDFETRATENITKTSAHRYALDAQIICMAIKFDDEPVVVWWPAWVANIIGEAAPYQIIGRLIHNLQCGFERLIAHNTGFEYNIWNEVLTPEYGLPPTKFADWSCTAARARVMALPGGLAALCQVLNMPIQKDKVGADALGKICKPRKPTKDDASIWNNDPDLFRAVIRYCAIDVDATWQLDKYLPELVPGERETWLLDQKINATGIPIDKQLCQGSITMVSDAMKEFHKEFQSITGIPRATQREKFRAWLTDKSLHYGFPMPHAFGKDVVENWLSEHASEVPEYCLRALQLYRLAVQKATAKYNAFMKYSSPDGRLRGGILFHGATTGRYTSKGAQLQNIKRGDLSRNTFEFACEIAKTGDFDYLRRMFQGMQRKGKDPLKTYEVLGSCARGAIAATPGHKIVWADINAIEARKLLWFCEQEDGLDNYRNDVDGYKLMAGVIFKENPDNIGDESFERWLGKQTVLGCGYQMGWKKFIAQCLKYGRVVAEFLAKESVNAFREVNHKVKDTWGHMQECALYTTRTGNPITVNNKVTFEKLGDEWLTILLPSGRKLWYNSPRVKTELNQWGKLQEVFRFKQWCHKSNRMVSRHMYGGKWVQHTVQAMSRDTMVFHQHLTDSSAWNIITHTHDEIITEEPLGGREPHELATIMSTVPPWAPGLPIKAEGKQGQRYRK